VSTQLLQHLETEWVEFGNAWAPKVTLYVVVLTGVYDFQPPIPQL